MNREYAKFRRSAVIVSALARFVSERRERRQFLSAQLLRELAEHDSLTGLLNRRAFGQYFRQAWRQAQRERADLSGGSADAAYPRGGADPTRAGWQDALSRRLPTASRAGLRPS